MSVVSSLIESIGALPGKFVDVAFHDPLGAVLLAVGVVLIALASAVLGVLVLGGLADLVTPSSAGRTHRPT